MSTAQVVARRRAIAAGPAVLGIALAAQPHLVTAAVCGSGARPAAWLVRILGARMIGQSIVTGVRPTRSIELAGIAADASHAASMVWAARRYPQYRRAAVTSAAAATVSALASLTTLRS